MKPKGKHDPVIVGRWKKLKLFDKPAHSRMV